MNAGMFRRQSGLSRLYKATAATATPMTDKISGRTRSMPGLYARGGSGREAYRPWLTLTPTPIGHATPVAVWQSYPFGFLAKYCWWSSSAK